VSSTTTEEPAADSAVNSGAPEGSQRADHRIAGADGLRAAAALAVVFSHLFQRLSMGDHGGAILAIQGMAMKGAYGVSIFFVLSGTLLSYPFWTAYLNGAKMPSLRHYAKRRAARIIPGFYVALTVSFLVVLAWYPTTLHPLVRYVAGLSFLSGWHWLTFFPAESNGPLWSISLEVMSYIFMPLAMLGLFVLGRRLTGGRGRWGALYWVGVLAVVVLINQWIITTFIPSDEGKGWQFGDVGGAKEWLPYYNPVGFFAHFALGIAAAGFIAWIRVRGIRKHWGFDVLGVAGLLGLVWLVWATRFPLEPEIAGNFQNQPYLWPWLAGCAAVALIGASHSRVLGRVMDNRFARYTATVSFGIYVWHYLVVGLVELLTNGEFTYGNVHDLGRFALMCLTVLVMSYAIASASWFWMEKKVLSSRWARSPTEP